MRDPRFENWFQTRKVPYEYRETYDLGRIDVRASRTNHARLKKALDPEWVAALVQKINDGTTLPALVLWERASASPEGELAVLADGNHRDEAYRQVGLAQADAYILHVGDPALIDAITRTLNGIEGRGFLPEETMTHAIYLVEQLKWSIEQAADWQKVSKSSLRDKIAARKTIDRLHKMGQQRESIVDSVYYELSRLRFDPVMGEAHELAFKATLSPPTVSRMITEINRERSEAAQLEVVERWRQKPEVAERMIRGAGAQGKRRRIDSHPRTKFLTAISRLEGALTEQITLADLQFTKPEDVAALTKRCEVLSSKLRRLCLGTAQPTQAGQTGS
jgi:hypothetical protein